MTSVDAMDQLLKKLPRDTPALFDLITLYLDQNTTPEQRVYLREKIHPMRHQFNTPSHRAKWSAMQWPDYYRHFLAYLSLIDGLPGIDTRDDTLMMNRLVDGAYQHNVNLREIAAEVKAISSPQARWIFGSLERSEPAPRSSSTEMPTQKPPEAGTSLRGRLASWGDEDVPIRMWAKPVVFVAFMLVILTITGLSAINDGEDPRTVLFLGTLFLFITTPLYIFFREQGRRR